MQNTEGYGALIGANRGCFAAFAAVYECEVPVIAAVHGYCLGGGIGLVGNAAAELHHFGSVLEVVPGAELREAARAVARNIAAKSPTVIRRAKESLNGIDPVDVKRSYRFEQGFTFELNLGGVSDEDRQAFVDKRQAEFDK